MADKNKEIKEEICPVCKNRITDCVCCPECGHVCARDQGELYCPVCGPAKPEPGQGVGGRLEDMIPDSFRFENPSDLP